MMPMEPIPERDQEEQEEENIDEEFYSDNRCLALFCFPFGLRKTNNASSRRSLLHDESTREKWWAKRSKNAKEFVLRSMDSFKFKTLVQKLRCKHNLIKRRKPMFRYDSKSYTLNFDEGGDRGSEEDQLHRRFAGLLPVPVLMSSLP